MYYEVIRLSGRIIMKSKERVIRAINRQEIDHVPCDMKGTGPEMIERLMGYYKVSTKEGLWNAMGLDIWHISPMNYKGETRYYNGAQADYWGVSYRAKNDGDSSRECPLYEITSIREAENYKWPSPLDFSADNIEKEIDTHSEFAIIGGVWAPIFHNLTWLCGFENTLVNLHTQPELSEFLISKITDFWVGYTQKVLEAGKGKIDIIENCNDFGGQNTLLMSPEIFRKYFKPALARLFRIIKEFDVKVMQHCCGAIEPIINDFIEIGADILNPIQVSASGMEILYLKKTYGEKITFHGGIDTQYLLPKGTESDVRREVKRTIQTLAEGGGYILAGSQGFQSDIPLRNIYAMYDEAKNITLTPT